MIAILEMCHHTVKKSPWRSHPNHEIVQMEMCELRNEGRACIAEHINIAFNSPIK